MVWIPIKLSKVKTVLLKYTKLVFKPKSNFDFKKKIQSLTFTNLINIEANKEATENFSFHFLTSFKNLS